jgi:hypothetical protein
MFLGGGDSNNSDHPNTRAILFEDQMYSTRKIRDFSDILTGFESICTLISHFEQVELKSVVLKRILKPSKCVSSTDSHYQHEGIFPYVQMMETLAYFREIFDEKQVPSDLCMSKSFIVNVN